MTPDELAIKLTNKLEYMIQQYIPRPECVEKQKAHKELVQDVKNKIAQRISGSNGLNITIAV